MFYIQSLNGCPDGPRCNWHLSTSNENYIRLTENILGHYEFIKTNEDNVYLIKGCGLGYGKCGFFSYSTGWSLTKWVNVDTDINNAVRWEILPRDGAGTFLIRTKYNCKSNKAPCNYELNIADNYKYFHLGKDKVNFRIYPVEDFALPDYEV